LSPYALLAIALLILAFGGGLYVLNRARSRAAALVSQAQAEASRILEAARREAERLEKEATLETKERMLNWRAEFERESQERRQELSALDKRLSLKEAGLDLRAAALEEKEKESLNREGRLRQNEAAVTRQREEVDRLLREQQRQLEKLSGLTTEDAKRQLLKTLEQEARRDAANLVKRIEDEAREQAQVLARRYTVEAIQRSAADHAAETTVSVVDLPNDDLKGRIIGREGRNIRALEMATGVDLIVDDTPGAIVDGRIHPARIEEMVERVKAELDEQMRQTGEAAAFELGIHDLHPELIRLLGRLKYRTSYGQNVLQHSKEVAYLSGFLARECGANAAVAIRGGLLHDIGKAIDRDVEGTHLELGIDLLHKYSESEEVVWAMEAHHLDREFRTLESMLVQAADAISASRPGARRDLLESYVKRLEKLESIAGSFKGVSKSFALQAGREIRIVVEADKVSDEETFWLSKDVARRIESELQYPGQIKVTVIRETRAVDYAK
jgi:ribonuclease Y